MYWKAGAVAADEVRRRPSQRHQLDIASLSSHLNSSSENSDCETERRFSLDNRHKRDATEAGERLGRLLVKQKKVTNEQLSGKPTWQRITLSCWL